MITKKTKDEKAVICHKLAKGGLNMMCGRDEEP
jgi:hypothetical protein